MGIYNNDFIVEKILHKEEEDHDIHDDVRWYVNISFDNIGTNCIHEKDRR